MVISITRRWAARVGLLAVVSAAPHAWAAKRFPDFPAPPESDLNRFGDNEFSAGAYVMSAADDQKFYFGRDLNQYSIAPIWLSLSNNSQAVSLLIDTDGIMLSKDATPLTTAERGKSSVSSSGGTAVAVGSLALVSIAGGLLAESMIAHDSAIRRNLVEKQLYSRTIAPEQNVTGFIYVTATGGALGLSGFKLSLTAQPIPASVGNPSKTYTTML